MVKDKYPVIYRGENRNLTQKLNEMINDLEYQEDIYKAMFLMGFLTKRIVKLQLNLNLGGKFVENMYKKIRNHKDIVVLFNKISEMINSKYKKQLGYLQPVLEEIASKLVNIEKIKFDKDYATFSLLQGFQLENRFVSDKEEDIENNEEEIIYE